MAHTTERIEALAQIEKAAAAARSRSEAEWREAWWDVSLALAEPEKKADVTAAFDVAERVLGQNRNYIKMRRRVAVMFGQKVLADVVRTLPPGMCTALAVRLPEITPEVADLVLHSDRNGESVNDVLTALGVVAPHSPAARPTFIAEGLADPTTAAKVVARMDDETKATMAQALGADVIASTLADPVVRQKVIDRMPEKDREALSKETFRSVMEDDVARSGGRIPTLAEINGRDDGNPMDAIVGDIERAGEVGDALRKAERLVKAYGPIADTHDLAPVYFRLQMLLTMNVFSSASEEVGR